MKIELPGNNKQNKSKPKEKPNNNGRIRWRKRGQYICASINKQYVSINIKTFEIIFSNGFKISSKSIEDGKNKAKDFLGYKK